MPDKVAESGHDSSCNGFATALPGTLLIVHYLILHNSGIFFLVFVLFRPCSIYLSVHLQHVYMLFLQPFWSCITFFRNPVGFFVLLVLIVLFRPCSIYLFLFSTYICCSSRSLSDSLQVTIKTNLLAELKHQAPNYKFNRGNSRRSWNETFHGVVPCLMS